MITVYAIHAIEENKLNQVKDEMKRLGAPKINVVNCGDHYVALAGSHRLAAAHELGINPEFTIIEQDEVINIVGYDWFDASDWDGVEFTAGFVAGELYDYRQAVAYSFED